MSRWNATFWSKVGETGVGEMGVGKQGPIQQYFMQPFLPSMKLLKRYTHALTKCHTEVTSWISRAYGCRLCMELTWSELNYYAWFVLSVSSLPLSVMVRSCHACVVFVPRASFTPTLRSGSSPSPTWQRAGHIACTSLHEIFKCAHFKFTVYGRKQTDIQCSRAREPTL